MKASLKKWVMNAKASDTPLRKESTGLLNKYGFESGLTIPGLSAECTPNVDDSWYFFGDQNHKGD